MNVRKKIFQILVVAFVFSSGITAMYYAGGNLAGRKTINQVTKQDRLSSDVFLNEIDRKGCLIESRNARVSYNVRTRCESLGVNIPEKKIVDCSIAKLDASSAALCALQDRDFNRARIIR